MRRLPAALLLGIVALIPAAASAAPSDTAIGHGRQDLTASQFKFNARSGPDGQDPSGTMSLDTAAFSVEADVTCLSVLDGRATLIGEVTRSEGITATTLVFFAEDNRGAPDNFQYVVTSDPTQEPCAPLGATLPIDRGNIVVHDR
jgi:hypothetical protein